MGTSRLTMRDERLVPIVKTRMAPRLTRAGATPHLECWAARTVDGVWDFEREDFTGTNWLTRHVPSVADGSYTTPVEMHGTLRAARISVGAGRAASKLRMLKCPHPADQRGHRVERGTWDYHYETCGACGALRAEHGDDDGCKTCMAYESGDGPGHDWHPEV
jgi:hypothetical protein